LVGHRNGIRGWPGVGMLHDVRVVLDVVGERYALWYKTRTIAALHFLDLSIAPADLQGITVGIDTTGFSPGDDGGTNGQGTNLLYVYFSCTVVRGK